ncbi:MAG: PQQ-binding-like beta-propeller repeat protein [Verrucomicrobiales bacterium]|nr:PQQ-binding-like beta-propeller repeat protein [Verrucomicrobiales bacterium]
MSRRPWIAILLLVAASAEASEWPQWRGPQRTGQSVGLPWPERIDPEHLAPAWRVKLSPSYSGPIIVDGRVFTTETRDKKFEVVRAFDRESGKELWRTEWEGAVSVPFFAKSNGDWIRSTPAGDGESVFVAGMRDVMVCLDAATGRERWRFDFVEKLKSPVPDFGFVCSPLLDDTAVYVQAGASLAKLDKRTGDVLWRTLRDKGGMWGSVFSSPVFATLAGERQLVVQTREKLAGVRPADGQVLWEQPVEAFRGMNILTPVVQDDLVFTSTYGGKTVAFRVERQGERFSTKQAWQHKAQGYMSTPVVIEGVAYHHLKSQRVMAIEVATGRELWTSDKSFGKYWSLVARGEQILALDQRGDLYLLRANRNELEVLDQRRLTEEEAWAHLAVDDAGIVVRELNGLSAFRWRSKTPPKP